jgi:hypothetical protein
MAELRAVVTRSGCSYIEQIKFPSIDSWTASLAFWNKSNLGRPDTKFQLEILQMK